MYVYLFICIKSTFKSRVENGMLIELGLKTTVYPRDLAAEKIRHFCVMGKIKNPSFIARK